MIQFIGKGTLATLHTKMLSFFLQEIVQFLVEFGCDVNAQDSDGWTPLHCAASCNNLPMVRFLVEHGACIFATTLRYGYLFQDLINVKLFSNFTLQLKSTLANVSKYIFKTTRIVITRQLRRSVKKTKKASMDARNIYIAYKKSLAR